VQVSERESGYNRLWWKEAHTALKAAEQNGWRNHRAVWASTSDAYQVAHATWKVSFLETNVGAS
jgi:hypothetical protein